MIRLVELRKTFGPVTAVDGVSFEVSRGSILGFLGPNGAGKSTTLRVLAGYLAPTSGQVFVGGVDVADPAVDFRRHLGYLPESAPLYTEMSVRGLLRFVARVHRVSHPKKAVEAVIERVGLGPMAHRRVGTLSKGYRQRVGLAQALVHDPQVVVLDEPTSGLDPNQIIEIREVIRALGADKTVIFSSHRLDEVQAIADRVVVLNHGRVVADAPLASLRGPLGSTLEVEVGHADCDAVQAALAAVPGVTGVVVRRVDDRAVAEVSADTDVRAAVAAAVCPRWPLLRLGPREDELSRVFRALTQVAP